MTEEEAKEKAKEEIMNLLIKHRSHWLALTRRFVRGHQAEDVLQIGIEHIIKILPEVPHTIKNPGAWITTVLTRRALDELRRADTEARALEKHGVMPETWSDPDVIEAAEGYLQVRDVLSDVLPDRQHHVYVLVNVGKYSGDEIAKMLGIKATSVRKDLQKARAVLETTEVRERLRKRLQD
ncbi:RNA polymerase sigma factor [Streptomyces bottropensis]|uniref:RNA polymerase sigma factor n=1 Tax=Streptomyces bottropensis TaxID=42235 RepID=UPI0036818F3A